MSLVAWMVVGALAGLLFAVVYFRPRYAYMGGVVLGAFGGIVGGFIHGLTLGHGATRFNPWSLPAAIAGALVLLVAFQMARRAGHGT